MPFSLAFLSFPDSGWERTALEALPRLLMGFMMS